MFHTKAALAALCCIAVWAMPARAAQSPQTLSLPQAFTLALDSHPELRRLPLRRDLLTAESEQAAQAPARVLGASLENALGSGDLRGVDGAELSLSLSSVIEARDKRDARIAVADGRLAGLDAESHAQRLDLLAEVARRYLDALAAQSYVSASAAHVTQRRQTVAAAGRRVQAGASPQSILLSAEAALARAELEQARSREDGRSARRALALLWGEAEPTFGQVQGVFSTLPAVPTFAALSEMLDRSPEQQRFASEARLREARLQLARSQARPDLQWQLGVQRLESEGSWALLGGVSVPLGNARRAQPGIRAAQADLAGLALEREASELSLRATLADAHGQMQADALTVERLQGDVLPKLQRAEASAAAAYRAGALSHLEWSQLQVDLLATRREQIAAARDFHRALIEIQRLTAEPFVLAPPMEATP